MQIKLSYRPFVLFLFVILVFPTMLAQVFETDADKNKPSIILKEDFKRGTRSELRLLDKNTLNTNNGNETFLRIVSHDGNLVTGGVVNSGLLSYHYVGGTPRISWPKGSRSVSYLHGAVFFVAAEVVDTSGQTVHIVSDNYRRGGETSNDFTHLYATTPLPGYFNLDQPDAIGEPLINGISEDVGIDGIPNTGDEGEGDGILQTAEDFNGNGVLDLAMQNEVGWFAISSRRETWPRYWPGKSYPGDNRDSAATVPGVRAGRWNGEYGAYVRADQESYFALDDRENDEFAYFPFDDPSTWVEWPNGRRGLGMKVEVRNYQWSSRLAEDIFISVYDITNEGKDLEKCIVGMYVDPDIGGSLSGDDASFDNIDDITYAWTLTGYSSEGLPTGYYGFAFLESPGLSQDGIDNDEDGMTDESQNDLIDNDGDWIPWQDQNGNGIWDTEDLNYNGILDSGEDLNGNGRLDSEPLFDDLGADGLGPEFDGYTGPDEGEANGVPDLGEPNFESTDNDESDQVGLTSWYLRDVDNTMANDEDYWNIEIQPGTYETRPGYQRDIAWSYGSGFVEFAGTEKQHRYAIALLFGNDQADILRNKRTMQVIYDNDYNFSKPPRKPLLTATPSDEKVFLSWDSRAETSRDPVYGQDFEAYYVYRGTDASFSDIKTISDAFGNPLLFKPLAIFDLNNGLSGIHPVRIGSELGPDSDLGVSYNMGTDSGLRHQFVDTTVTNGRTYFYAVVSVDRGYDDSFYPEFSDREGLAPISPTECSAVIQTDPLGRPIFTDQNTAVIVPHENSAGYVAPSVDENGIEHIAGRGTGDIIVSIFSPNEVINGQTYHVTFGDDGELMEWDSASYTGYTNRMTLNTVSNDVLSPVKSLANPETNEFADEFISEGIQVTLLNDPIGIDTSYWTVASGLAAPYNATLYVQDLFETLGGIPVARDYEIRVMAFPADTSINGNRETNFQIWDITREDSTFQLSFRYTPNPNKPDSLFGHLYFGDKIILVNNPVRKKQLWKWEMRYPAYVYNPDSLKNISVTDSMETLPLEGDLLQVRTTKPFDRHDVLAFTVTGNRVENAVAKNQLDNIYTVPDPYIAVSTLERKVINFDEGRGDRRIDFVNLPEKCKISIFTASGRLVRTLNHNAASSGFNRESWDLRTLDGLEVAHGVYFWVVEADGIGKKAGKLAIIK
jgi:hypothetical protein